MLHQTANSFGNFNYNAYVYDDAEWESHFHGNFELIYILDGKTEVTVNGKTTTLKKGELLLIAPYTVHALRIGAENKTWIGVFSEDYIENFAARKKQERYLPFTCDADVETFLLKNLFYQGTPERYMLIACLNMVCDQCIRYAQRDTTKQSNSFVEAVVSYVSEHLSEEISLEEMAKKLGYEYHYFSALFHENFAMHFKSFIHLFRFEKACRLIDEGKNDMTRIADLCGFGSVRNFNRVFKNLSGMTPGAYQKRMV